MKEEFLLALARFGSDVPWYIVGCAPFMDNLRVKKRVLFLMILGVGSVRAVTNYLLVKFVPDYHDYLGWEYVVFTGVIIIFYILAMRIRVMQLVYVMLLLQSLATTVNYLAYVVNVPFYPGETIRASTTPGYTFSIIVGSVLCAVLTWYFFRTRLRDALDILPDRMIVLLCIPPMMFWLVHQVYNSTVVYSQSTWNIAVLNMLILLTGLMVYYLNIKMVLDSARHVRIESEAEKSLALQAQNYENLTQNIEAARTARHDLRHHINVLKGFIEEDDKEGMLRYMDEYTASLPIDNAPDWCESQVVNALVKHYLARASQSGVRLDVKLDLPLKCGVPETDLCVVFGNIFENAANAAASVGKGAYIRARCKTGERDIVLAVENSVGHPTVRGEGLGQKNVEAAAKRNKGTARFTEKDGVYSSRVILRKTAPEEY